ncbi:MAG TPA: NUDIX domain-containing protein [Candidatus Nanoarchaeia archaeon]|nr:NUDIX domain-containing protein [Candidatus Nanoarchaeia archaeon]
MRQIHKAAALIFKEKKLLIVRPKGKNYWIHPGGKYEGKETAEECLKRELVEELQVKLRSFSHYKTYHCQHAAEDNIRPLLLELYLVEIDGVPKPSQEIAELGWLGTQEIKQKTFNLNHNFPEQIHDLIEDKLL